MCAWRDNWPGVPGELRRKIFSAGFSTKESGWGIGLALTRRIIEAGHSGRLRLTPSATGAVFDIELPGRSRRSAAPCDLLLDRRPQDAHEILGVRHDTHRLVGSPVLSLLTRNSLASTQIVGKLDDPAHRGTS